MKQTIKAGLIAAIAAMTLWGCGSGGETANGTPETRQTSPSPTPLTATYSSISQDIIGPKCLSCHGGTQPEGNLNLSTYPDLTQNPNFPTLVVPAHPEQSLLYTLVSEGAMPLGGTKLSDAELQAISQWITAGAQNN